MVVMWVTLSPGAPEVRYGPGEALGRVAKAATSTYTKGGWLGAIQTVRKDTHHPYLTGRRLS